MVLFQLLRARQKVASLENGARAVSDTVDGVLRIVVDNLPAIRSVDELADLTSLDQILQDLPVGGGGAVQPGN